MGNAANYLVDGKAYTGTSHSVTRYLRFL